MSTDDERAAPGLGFAVCCLMHHEQRRRLPVPMRPLHPHTGHRPCTNSLPLESELTRVNSL